MSASLPVVDPSSTALLVMDMQVGILDSLADSDVILGRTAEAIGTVRRLGGQISYIRVGFADEDLVGIPPHSRMANAAASGAAYHADAPSTAIHHGVAPEPGDIVVRKTRIGPFLTTDLDEQLRGRGVDTLILSGVSTSGVVLSTVRDGSDRDYRIFVLRDATADRRADVHDFLLDHIFPSQAGVITVDQLGKLLSAEAQ